MTSLENKDIDNDDNKVPFITAREYALMAPITAVLGEVINTGVEMLHSDTTNLGFSIADNALLGVPNAVAFAALYPIANAWGKSKNSDAKWACAVMGASVLASTMSVPVKSYIREELHEKHKTEAPVKSAFSESMQDFSGLPEKTISWNDALLKHKL